MLAFFIGTWQPRRVEASARMAGDDLSIFLFFLTCAVAFGLKL